MTRSDKILSETHRSARDVVKNLLRFDTELYSNNHNRQMLMYFELFRQTAYAMIQDGGPDIAIELMQKVINEQRELKKARRANSFNEGSFRRSQDENRNLWEWGLFMNIPYADEVPLEDDN